jgi:hypothetical protein
MTAVIRFIKTREPAGAIWSLAAAGNARPLSNLVAGPSQFSKDFNVFLAGPDYTAVKKRQ